LALNFYTQGIHPGLDVSDIQTIIDTVTQCNDLPIHPRYPYAGELVYTAFSGSHQDAIKKGFEAQRVRHQLAADEGKPQYWDIPYLPIDPADIGQTYEAIIRVNSQSGKGGIAYLVKQHMGLDLPRKLQVAFYQVVQAISDREAREVTVDDITTAFRTTYYLGGAKYRGRLALRNFKISAEPAEDPVDDSDEIKDERRRFDGTLSVDGLFRVIRGDGNGPLSALLDALRAHLAIDLTIREYTEHSIGEGKEAKAASYVELVPAGDRKSSQSWWGVGVDSDIAGSGLRALLSAVNCAVGDRPLPELKLTVGFNVHSGPADIASLIVNALGLELPRRLQASFFEVVQRTANDSKGEISHEGVIELFQSTYGYYTNGGPALKLSLGDFKLEQTENRNRRFIGDIVVEGERQISTNGVGNGPLSATLMALHDIINGVLTIREYSEHSIGEGTEVLAASYVELSYEVPGAKKVYGWGVSTDTDITGSGIKAVLTAASNIGVVLKV
jgi:2-isopropylmalate synthase